MNYNAFTKTTVMIYEYNDYRQFLSDLLVKRIKINSAYSLRSMAKNLEISPSTLSDVIRGKKNFSIKTAATISKKLNLKSREAKYFNLLVQYCSTKKMEMKNFLKDSLNRINQKKVEFMDLSPDYFYIISKWYHLPIIEMTYLSNFKFSASNISKALEITTLEADAAIERLTRMKLIKKNDKNQYIKTHQHFLVQSEIPNEALREYHAQMIDKAKSSLHTQTPQEKSIGSENVSIAIEDLEEAKIIIEECFQRIIQLSEKQKQKSHVYHLGIQLFNLTPSLGMKYEN